MTNRKKFQLVSEYTSAMAARGFISRVQEEFQLCGFLCGIDKKAPCFNFQLHQCEGACTQKESAEDYNKRAILGQSKLSTVFDKDFFILEQGRSPDEFAVVQIEGGVCKGFGYLDQDANNSSYLESLQNAIKPYPAFPETTRIIRTYLRKNPKAKRIPYNRNKIEF